MRLCRASLTAFGLIAVPAVAMAAEPATPCGTTTVIRRNDTLSGIAERCDVPEAALLDANPAIRGSGDLQAGATLRLRAANDTGRGVGAAVSSFSRRAGDAVGALANDVGASVQDLLDRNPDLRTRLDRLGRTVGLPDGLTGDQPSAAVTVLPRSGPPGTVVTITANGLQPNSPVAIGAGAPGTAYNIVAHVRSTPEGTVQTRVTVPDDAGTGRSIVFSVSTGSGVLARTGRFAVGD